MVADDSAGVTSLVYDREAVLGQAPTTERARDNIMSFDTLFALRRKATSYAER